MGYLLLILSDYYTLNLTKFVSQKTEKKAGTVWKILWNDRFQRIFGRSGEAQTRGLRIPNAARYQLRYTPIVIKLWSCKWSNLWSNTFLTAFFFFRTARNTHGWRVFGGFCFRAVRTPSMLPNVARYQLRHTPIVIKLWSCKWSNLWSNTFLTAIFCFPYRPKFARLKGFRRLAPINVRNAVYAPKPPALPTAPHLDV